jgi:hypothetical protein
MWEISLIKRRFFNDCFRSIRGQFREGLREIKKLTLDQSLFAMMGYNTTSHSGRSPIGDINPHGPGHGNCF